MERKAPGRWFLWTVAAAAVALRLGTLPRGWHLDEFATLEVLGAPNFRAAMALVRADPHHPLFFALLYGWRGLLNGLLGDPAVAAGAVATWPVRFWLRSLPLAFDLGTLALFARQAWRAQRAGGQSIGSAGFWAPGVGLALWGVCPLALRFAAELRPYSGLIFFALLSYVTLAEKARWPWSMLACMACIAMHPVGVFAVAAVACALWLCRADTRRACARQLGPALCGSGLLFGLLHWGFTLDPGAARISWMPAMSLPLFAQVVGVCFGLENSRQYGTLSQALYLGGTTGLVWLLLLSLHGRRAGPRGRAANLAALLLGALLVAYSAWVQPIFWYRSLAPSVALLLYAVHLRCLVAPPRPQRRLVWLLAPALLWQFTMALPLLGRAVDPVEQAARQVLAAHRPREPIYVFPDWFGVCLNPLADAQTLAQVRPMEQGPRTDGAAPAGVALVRSNTDLWQAPAPAGLRALLQAFAWRGALREVVFIHDDNDDVSAAGLAARDKVLQEWQQMLPDCRPHDGGRTVHLVCSAGR